MTLTPKESLRIMAARIMSERRNANTPDKSQWNSFTKAAAYESALAVVRSKGGYREKSIISQPHFIAKSDTWNAAHKVVNIIAYETDKYGHRDSIAIDIVTMSIVG